LKEVLYLFVNSKFMATPYTSASGSTDAYNFFYSQLHICVKAMCLWDVYTTMMGDLKMHDSKEDYT
jgi:hypothetical protein